MQKNKSLKPYNTFSISVDANYFAEILSEQDLLDVLKSDLIKQQSLLVLGGGSNVLFTKDFDGLVMKISIPGISSAVKGDEIVVTAGAGVVWNDLVKYCVQNGFAGIENLSLIPGTVGASPIQNIGAYGVELKDVFESCVAYEIATSEKRVFNFKDCRFGYRDSVFKNELKGQYIITSVSFKLSKSAKINSQYGAIQEELSNKGIATPTIKDISDVVSEIRVAKLPDPSTIGNAGAFLKIPLLQRMNLKL
ncbi:UDP-N-acetylmuramate dehydrogenase [Pedobacter steynii]